MEAVWNRYDQLWTARDQRVDGWLFMSSLKPCAFFITLAVSWVIYGPRYMKTRPPLNISSIMVAFNIFVVTLNLYIACQLSIGGYRKQYNFLCEPNDPTDTDDEAMRMLRSMHLMFFCKIIEMSDTFFLIARKKPAEQSGVLVIHHAGMAIIVWTVVRWVPSSSAIFPSMINSLAHAGMYTYFGLTFFQPTLVKSPLIKMAFNGFLITQTLVSLGYCFIVIWIQCPWAVHFCYASIAIAIGTTLFQGLKAIADNRRGVKSTVVGSTFKLSSD